MVTHDPRAAAIADRVLFLTDGLISRDAGQLTRRRDPRPDEDAGVGDGRARHPRAPDPQAPLGSDGDRDRARRRDDLGHVRPHGPDLAARSTTSSRPRTRAPTRSSSRTRAFGSDTDAVVPLYVPESLVGTREEGSGRARGRRRDHRVAATSSSTASSSSRRAALRRSSRPRPPDFRVSKLVEGRFAPRGGPRPDLAVDKGSPTGST